MSATWTGMDATSGAPLSDLDHVRQSIMDILRTHRGERVMLPEYGSNLFELVSRPMNAAFLLDLYYEAITAIHRWEPRVRVARIQAAEMSAGRVILDLEVRLDGGQAERVRLDALTLL